LSDLDLKTETLFEIYKEIQSQIKFSDTKTGLLLTSTGIMFVIIFDVYKHLGELGVSCTQQILILVSLFCNIGSLIIYIVSIFPRKGSDIQTIFYWGKICSYKNDEYLKKISELNESDLVKDLSNQICIISEICDSKMSYFKYGTFMLTLAIIVTGILFFFIYAK